MDYIKPLMGSLKPRVYAVLDIESKDGDTQRPGFTRPFLLCYHGPGGEKWHTDGDMCVRAAIALILTPRTEGWVFYAHNGGSFDWLHFLPHLHALGFHFEISSVGSSIQVLRVKRSAADKGPGWTFLDSMKLLPMSLEKAGRSFGLGGKDSADLSWHETDTRWLTYCARDCELLYKVLERYHELVEIRLNGEVGVSAASTAMRTFRRGYQTTHIHRHLAHHDLFRECYYGGRTEVFRRQAPGVHYYDRNSSYPASMLCPQPVGEAFEHIGRPLPWMLQKCVGYVRAEVNVPMMHVPPLPYRRPSDGKLLFPVGEFEGSWVHHELLIAEQMGAHVEWGKSVWIHTGLPFDRMVRELYAYRDQSRPDYDEGLASVAKILLNALYGKFAQRTEHERIVNLAEGDLPPEGSEPLNPEDPDCMVYRVTETKDSAHVAPQISANITALSRLSLLEKMLESERICPGGLAYCDTDSVITPAIMTSSYALGGWKDELKGLTCHATILAPKLYRLDVSDGSVKLAMKGFRSAADESYDALVSGGPGAVQALAEANFEALRGGGAVRQLSLEKVLTMAKKGWKSPEMRVLYKQLNRNGVEKRQFKADGTSKPLKIEK